ncbi:MAG: DUF6228 family protein [Methylotenera sp.]
MVEFKSSDNGATISFSAIGSSSDGTEFYFEVKTPFGSAKILSSTYFNGSPAQLFKSMATDWRGWSGEKVWSDLESSVILSARSDSIGHTKLKVKLTDYESSFETVIIFEAGQLERMANEIATHLP